MGHQADQRPVQLTVGQFADVDVDDVTDHRFKIGEDAVHTDHHIEHLFVTATPHQEFLAAEGATIAPDASSDDEHLAIGDEWYFHLAANWSRMTTFLADDMNSRPVTSTGCTREEIMDFKLELVFVPVSDVDRAKAFYADQVGFIVDHDHVVE